MTKERMTAVAIEPPRHPRPQPGVHRRRVLGLQAADPLERRRQRLSHTREQELPGQQRPVQLPLCERARR